MSPNNGTQSHKHNIAYIVRICCIAALGGILLGYDTAVISGAIGPIRDHFGLTPAQTGWAVSSVVLGSIIGAVSAGTVALKYGRRSALFLSAVLFVISAIGSAIAPTFTIYVLLRIIGGVAVGFACVGSPLLMFEGSPKNFCGRVVRLFYQKPREGRVGEECRTWWARRP